MPNTIRVTKLPDNLVLKYLKSFAEKIQGKVTDIQLLGSSQSITPNNKDHANLIAQLEESTAQTIFRVIVHGADQHINFQFYRRITVGTQPPSYSVSTLYDEIEIHADNLQGGKFAPLYTALTFLSEIFNIGATPTEKEGEEETPRAMVESIFQGIQNLTLDVSKQLTETRRKMEDEQHEFKKKIEADYDQRKAQLQTESDAERAKIAQERETLEKERKALDDRHNTHARRGIHKELKEAIKGRYDRFQLTKETKRLRLPIHIVCCLAIVALIVAISYFGSQMTDALNNKSDLSTIAFYAVKSLGLTLALLALVAYYIRWMNRWFDKHADAEFALKQFDLDVDRASWVVETGLEWRAAGGGAIPNLLLQGLTRRLFEGIENRPNEEMHPADYLASALLGSASSVDLTVPGGQIKYDKGGMKKLQKEAPDK